EVHPGDFVEVGKPVLAVARKGGLRLDVTVSNEDVGELRVGLPARVKLDAFDYQKYGTMNGKVISISPDAEDKDGRIVYLVKVELEGEEVGKDDLRGRVQLGMTAQVEIVTDRDRLLTILVRKMRHAISLS